MSKDRCGCKLDDEFVCGIIRHSSGIDERELDYLIRHNRVRFFLNDVIFEVQCLLDKLIDMRSKMRNQKEDWRMVPESEKHDGKRCPHCGEVYD